MATGDINDPLSDIPGITLRDNTDAPTDQGAGFALLKFKNGLPVWLPHGGAVRTALALGAVSQLSTLTEEASPADTDLFLMERASDGALRKVQASNLPGGGGGGAITGPFDQSSVATLHQGVDVSATVTCRYYLVGGRQVYLMGYFSASGSGTSGQEIRITGLEQSIFAAVGLWVLAGMAQVWEATSGTGRNLSIVPIYGANTYLVFYLDNQVDSWGTAPPYQIVPGDTLAFYATWILDA